MDKTFSGKDDLKIFFKKKKKREHGDYRAKEQGLHVSVFLR